MEFRILFSNDRPHVKNNHRGSDKHRIRRSFLATRRDNPGVRTFSIRTGHVQALGVINTAIAVENRGHGTKGGGLNRTRGVSDGAFPTRAQARKPLPDRTNSAEML